MESTAPRHHHSPIVVWPFLLIGAGIIALLANTGVISWDALGRIAGLWPLLLILVGMELIISRAVAPSIALPVNVALAAGTVIAVIALLLSGASFSVGSWWSTAATQTITRSAPIGDLERAQVNVDYGAAQVSIHSGSIGNDLYQARLTYAGNPTPTVTLDRQTGTVRVDRGSKGAFQVFAAGTKEQVDLVLSDRVAWGVSLNAGASQETVDLRGLTVTRLAVNGGAAGIEIDLPKPSGTVRVSINGGAMSLRLLVPSGVAVQLTANGGFSSITADGQPVSGLGHQTWQTANYPQSADRYELQISGGASSVRLERW